MINPYLASIIRHLATGLGCVLASRGYASEEQAKEIVGAVITFASIAWSAWHKYQFQRAAAAAAAGGIKAS